MSEKEEAIALANRLMDEPNADPDDDLRVLSRQLLRAHESLGKILPFVEMNAVRNYLHRSLENLDKDFPNAYGEKQP